MKRFVIEGLNHLLRNASWAQERLRAHSGAILLLEIGSVRLAFVINAEGLFSPADSALSPDVTLTLPLEALVVAAMDTQKLFSSVKLVGSADVAESLAFVVRNLRWDAEADLAGLIGDIPARRLTMLGRSLSGTVHQALVRTSENIADYAKNDGGLLVTAQEYESLREAILDLGGEIQRLEKRLAAF